MTVTVSKIKTLQVTRYKTGEDPIGSGHPFLGTGSVSEEGRRPWKKITLADFRAPITQKLRALRPNPGSVNLRSGLAKKIEARPVSPTFIMMTLLLRVAKCHENKYSPVFSLAITVPEIVANPRKPAIQPAGTN